MTFPEATTTLLLRDGRHATVRPLAATDVESLTAYFEGLSAQTRSFYGPHPFDRATAGRLCATIDPSRTVRFVALIDDGTPDARIIGYMILTRDIGPGDIARYAAYDVPLDPAMTASLAPSIADAFQEQGLGTAMARHVIDCARAAGLRRVILMGGVQARNERGRRMYERLGFVTQGEFDVRRDGILIDNYDMALDLRPAVESLAEEDTDR